jgi:ferredoxin
MSYERGYCRPECNRCSQICPAGAIKPITVEDKASTQIGHAVFIKKNCVVLRDEVECGNCASHCPTGAIEMVPSDPNDEESPYIPAVNEAVVLVAVPAKTCVLPVRIVLSTSKDTSNTKRFNFFRHNVITL